jgi:hypothetical protein
LLLIAAAASLSHGLRVPLAQLHARVPPARMCSAPPPATTAKPVDTKEAAKPVDPKAAMAERSTLTQQIQEVWTEGKTWSPETRAERRRSIVDTYVRVFAPALAFSGAQLSISLGAFGVVLLLLSVSGRGYADVAALGASVPLLGDALAQVGPGWGNAAIALLIVELSAPLLIPLAALATPAATDGLTAKLSEWGLDAEGLNAKIEKALQD